MFNNRDDDKENRSNYRFGEVYEEEDDGFGPDLTHRKKRIRVKKKRSLLPGILMGVVVGVSLGMAAGLLQQVSIPGFHWSYSYKFGDSSDDSDGEFGFDFRDDVEVNDGASSEYSLPGYQGDSSGLTIPLNQPGATESPVEMQPTDLYQAQLDATVSITVYAGKSAAYGSGVIVTEDGYILTCAHVIEDTEECVVTLSNDREYKAELVGSDPQTDLAVLKIKEKGLHAATFCDSDEVQVGEAAYAIGDPLGPRFKSSFTNGIISGLERIVSSNGYSMNLMQTTAAVNSGNSGGALFNRFGQVIGIVNMKMSNTGYNSPAIDNMGFAIPSRTVKRIVEELAKEGTISRAVLGITCYSLDEVSSHVNDVPEGLWIVTINEKSDCSAKGLLVGDIITEVNGKPIRTVSDVQSVIQDLKPGDTVTLTVWRDEKLAEEARRQKEEGDTSAEPEETLPDSSEGEETETSYHFEPLGEVTVRLISSQDIQ